MNFWLSSKSGLSQFRRSKRDRSVLGPPPFLGMGRLFGRVFLMLQPLPGRSMAFFFWGTWHPLLFFLKMIGVRNAVTTIQCSFGAIEVVFVCKLTVL